MKKVVAIGELLIDFVPQQRGCALDEVVQFERVAGGAPANVATAVARLGGRAQMIS
ncbi:MAG: PfkB family carbohydrate kinase [Butyricicoccus sp.]